MKTLIILLCLFPSALAFSTSSYGFLLGAPLCLVNQTLTSQSLGVLSCVNMTAGGGAGPAGPPGTSCSDTYDQSLNTTSSVVFSSLSVKSPISWSNITGAPNFMSVDTSFLYVNGTRALTSNWNAGSYNITQQSNQVTDSVVFKTGEFYNLKGTQARPWTPSPTGILIYLDFWGDAALTDLGILGTESVNTADTDVYGVHNFVSAATSAADAGFSIGPSVGATQTGTVYFQNVTNIFETRVKMVEIVNQTTYIGGFKTVANAALRDTIVCGNFFNVTNRTGVRGTTQYWHGTVCFNAGNCTQTNTTVPWDTNYHTYKMLPVSYGPRNRNGGYTEFWIDNILRANITWANNECTVAYIGAWEENVMTGAKNLRADYIYYDRVRS